jgi:hypothetical protein
MLKYKTKKYLKLFSDKNIHALSHMFSKNITLRDWKIKAKGLKNVLKENEKIFKSCKSIRVKPIKIFQEKKTIIAELHICINKSKNLLVIDVIEFDKQNKIKSIRAYLGN